MAVIGAAFRFYAATLLSSKIFIQPKAARHKIFSPQRRNGAEKCVFKTLRLRVSAVNFLRAWHFGFVPKGQPEISQLRSGWKIRP